MLCSICRVLMSDILIHLKGCTKTVPLHTTLPANPRYWLGADSKATPVGLCAARSKVINRKSNEREPDRQPQLPLIPIHICSWTSIYLQSTAAFIAYLYIYPYGPYLTACCHILHVRLLKVTVLKEAPGLIRTSPLINLRPLLAA